MVAETILEHVGITAGIELLRKAHRWRFFLYHLFAPNSEMRVAFSALARISEGGRYVLVKNLHRPETFSPFGGVFKYRNEAKRSLDCWQFRPQDIGPRADMINDLRGFVPRKHLAALVKWYQAGEDREALNECLNREFAEELREVGLAGLLKGAADLQYRVVRSVDDGPVSVPGMQYRQFRIFVIADVISENGKGISFVKHLFSEARKNPRLLIANSDEILQGRAADGRLIGSTACYLIGRRRVRQDDPPIVPRTRKVRR